MAVGLWQSGYHVDWIRCVGEGGERGGECAPCSRALLLALGWLLASGALETLLALRAQQLDSTRLDPAAVRTTVIQSGPSVCKALCHRVCLKGLYRPHVIPQPPDPKPSKGQRKTPLNINDSL